MSRRTAILVVWLAPAVADAATLCVRPTGVGCATTIQAAVDAARPGDTIEIARGIYLENVTIPPGKDRLRLVGAGVRATILDPDAPHSGTGLRIESNRVEVAALTVRNGRQYGVAIAAGVQGTFVHDARFIGGRGPAAITAEPGSTGLRIAQNEIRAAGVAGIELQGGNHGSLLRANVIEHVDRGIVALGDRIEIRANQISSTNTFAASVQGATPIVSDNVVTSAVYLGRGGRSLVVLGNDPTVRGNRLESAGPVLVSCETCARGVVAGNSSRGAVGFPVPGDAFRVTTLSAGLVLEGNFATRASAVAYALSGIGILARNNVAIDTGTPGGGHGFTIEGRDHRLVRNSVTRAGASGFQISGENGTFENNTAAGSGVNGFLVSGPSGAARSNNLVRNHAVGANAAGFAVQEAIATHLEGNDASGNRYDFCDDGSATLAVGNTFATTSTVCDVQE